MYFEKKKFEELLVSNRVLKIFDVDTLKEIYGFIMSLKEYYKIAPLQIFRIEQRKEILYIEHLQRNEEKVFGYKPNYKIIAENLNLEPNTIYTLYISDDKKLNIQKIQTFEEYNLPHLYPSKY